MTRLGRVWKGKEARVLGAASREKAGGDTDEVSRSHWPTSLLSRLGQWADGHNLWSQAPGSNPEFSHL